jgi:hypothetical protein
MVGAIPPWLPSLRESHRGCPKIGVGMGALPLPVVLFSNAMQL